MKSSCYADDSDSSVLRRHLPLLVDVVKEFANNNKCTYSV